MATAINRFLFVSLLGLLAASCDPAPAGPPAAGPPGEGGAIALTDGALPSSDGATAACSKGPGDEGCPCDAAGQTRACWPAAPSLRGIGACRDGNQSCVAQTVGEFTTLVWGACLGAVTQCGCAPGEFSSCDLGPPALDLAQVDLSSSPDLAPACVPIDSNGRCPAGSFGAGSCCQPCTDSTCTSHGECCAADVCKTSASCTMCTTGAPALDPSCNGRVDTDCDDYPEDCDMNCCPCLPAGSCGGQKCQASSQCNPGFECNPMTNTCCELSISQVACCAGLGGGCRNTGDCCPGQICGPSTALCCEPNMAGTDCCHASGGSCGSDGDCCTGTRCVGRTCM